MYQYVAMAIGNWDLAGNVFVGKQPAVTFNVSGAATVNLPTEHHGSGEDLQGTQYHDPFIQ